MIERGFMVYFNGLSWKLSTIGVVVSNKFEVLAFKEILVGLAIGASPF